MFLNHPSVVPPKGFVMEENGTPLYSVTREGLVDKLREHRIENGIPVGDPEKDVAFFFQRRQDIFDGKIPEVYPHDPVVSRIKNLADRISNWASNRYSKINEKINYVQAEDSSARAKICAQCPKNLNWRKTSTCAPCVANTDRVLLMLRRGNKTEQALGGCEFYGHDNEVAVFLPTEMLKHADREEFAEGPKHNGEPVPCWLYNESKYGRS